MTDQMFWPGDVIFTSAKSGIFRFIGPLTREPGEEATVATHVEAVSGVGTRETCCVVAPRSLVVGEHRFPGVADDDAEDVYVWRYTGWTSQDRARVAVNLMSQLDHLYGAHRLIGFAVDNLIARALGYLGWHGEVRLLSRLHVLSDLRVCSNVVAGAIHRATGYRFDGRDPERVTPDDMWDGVSADDDWEMIYSRRWRA